MEQYFGNHEVAYLSDRKVHKKTQTIRVHKAGVNEMSDMSNSKKNGRFCTEAYMGEFRLYVTRRKNEK